MVKVGDKVKAVVTKIDREGRKISLSIKEYKLLKEKEEVKSVLSSEEEGVFKLGDILKNVIPKGN